MNIQKQMSVFVAYALAMQTCLAPGAEVATPQSGLSTAAAHFRQLVREQAAGKGPVDGPSIRDLAVRWRALRGALRDASRRNSVSSGDLRVVSDLRQIHQDFRAYFGAIRARLSQAGLSEKLALLDEVSAEYESKISRVLTAAESLGSDRSAQQHLATALEADPPTPDNQAGVETVVPDVDPVSKAAPAVQNSEAAPAPGPDDLAESDLVNLTPEIRAQANALGNSPALIYEYVRNNVELLTHYGVMQNAQDVLASGKGNPAEQATLLIALMRAAGIPAHYATGTATLALKDAQNWLAVRSPDVAANVIRKMTQATSDGTNVSFQQTWAEAWVDQGSGPAWVPLDPSFKVRTAPQPPQLSPPAFDRIQYLRSQTTAFSTEVYLDSIRAALQTAYPGKAPSDVSYRPVLIPDVSGTLPSQLPFSVGNVTTGPLLDPLFAHRLRVTIFEDATRLPLLTHDFSVPAVALSSIAVSWIPATAADDALIKLFGGLSNTPAFLVKLKPQLLVDGQAVETGTVGLAPGTFLDVSVGFMYPFQTRPGSAPLHTLQLGGALAICLNANQLNEQFLGKRIQAFLNRAYQRTKSVNDALTGEMLSIAGWHYFSRNMTESMRAAEPLQLRAWLPSAEEGAASAGLDETDLFSHPLLVTPGSTLVDIKQAALAFYDVNSLSSGAFPTILQVTGITSSSMENALWEELVFAPSLSTVRGLQIAYKNNIPVLDITPDNAATLIPQIQGSDRIRKQIQDLTNAGAEVLMPSKPVQFNSFFGFVWIYENFKTGGYGYIITNSFGGQSTIDPRSTDSPAVPGTTGDPTAAGQTACGQPVTLSNGNMFHQFVDLGVADPFFPLQFVRTYNSQSKIAGPLGYGWTHNFQISAREAPEGVYFTNESGGVYLFARAQGGFSSPPLFQMQLTKDAQGYSIRTAHGLVYRFDTSGRLQTLTDPNSNVEKFSTDSNGNLVTVALPSGRSLRFEYGAGNRISAAVDSSGRRVTYAYDSRGDLISSKDAAGNLTQYAYYHVTGLRSLQTITYPEGGTIQFEYYANNKVSRTVDVGGSTMRFYYMPLENQTVLVDERGFATAYQYDSRGHMVRIVKPDGNVTIQNWNAAGQLTSSTDETGSTTTFAYDAQGNLTAVTDALGGKTLYTYETTFNQIVSAVDPLGNTTRFTYDAKGNLTNVTDALGGVMQVTHDSAGRITGIRDKQGGTSSFVFTNFDLTGTQDAAGGKRAFEYDSLGRTTATRDPLGNQSRLTWDVADRLVSATDALNHTVGFQYDREGRLTSTLDPLGRRTQYAYDQAGRLLRSTGPAGEVVALAYTQSDCGCSLLGSRPASLTDPNGSRWAYTYDYRHLPKSRTDPNGNTMLFNYDGAGYRTLRIDPDGNQTTYEYDALHRLTRRTYSTGQVEEFSYDAAGNFVSARNATTQLSYSYDALNRLVKVTDSRYDTPLQYTYDRASRVTGLSTPAGRTFSYVYDAVGRPTRVADANGQSADIQYDAAGQRSAIKYSNGARVAFQYDASGRSTQIQHFNSQAASIASFSYSYDAVGNPVSIGDTTGMNVFAYDAADQLVSASHPQQPVETYTYDPAHNRSSDSSSGYSYDAAGELMLTGAASFTYDRRGNLTSKTDSQGITVYSYDPENRLNQITVPSGDVFTYSYDALGRRAEKVVRGQKTKYVYDFANIVQEDNDSGGVMVYAGSRRVDDVLFFSSSSAAYFNHTDALGTVAAITDSSGSVAQSYSYSTFGAPLTSDPPLLTTARFTGRQYDPETGLYYYRARFYDPSVGRFLGADPLGIQVDGRSANLYSYARNNPMKFVDPSGLFDVFVFGSGQFSGAQPGTKGEVIALGGYSNEGTDSGFYTGHIEAVGAEAHVGVVGAGIFRGVETTSQNSTPVSITLIEGEYGKGVSIGGGRFDTSNGEGGIFYFANVGTGKGAVSVGFGFSLPKWWNDFVTKPADWLYDYLHPDSELFDDARRRQIIKQCPGLL